MIQDIKYAGYSAVPSDYDCADGELAMALGVVPENGALKPVMSPETVLVLEDGQQVVYIHTTSAFRHYIVYDTTAGTLSYTDGDGTLHLIIYFPRSIHGFTTVGNTLIALTDDGMYYFIWKGNTQGYLYLGNSYPECPLSFGLRGIMQKSEEFRTGISFPSDGPRFPYDLTEFNNTEGTGLTDTVLAKVNKFIADNSTNNGRFLYPFFVRYAYRLYDGSLTMHSAPILMVPDTSVTPRVIQRYVETYLDGTAGTRACLERSAIVTGLFHSLDYAVLGDTADLMQNWGDIIKSVDIFVSLPIYTYDQNGTCRWARKWERDNDEYGIFKHANPASGEDTRYQKNYAYDTFNATYTEDSPLFDSDPMEGIAYPDLSTVHYCNIVLPGRITDEVMDDIRNCAQFYLLASIPVGELRTTRTEIRVPYDYLQSLSTREAMTDDYDSHDKLIPQYAFNYNSRLNIANIRKRLFSGYRIGSLMPYTDGYVEFDESGTASAEHDRMVHVEIYVFIRSDLDDIVVSSGSGSVAWGLHPLYIYYPSIDAYKAVVEITDGDDVERYVVQLTPHDYLNGAFYFGGWRGEGETVTSAPVSVTEDNTVDIPNKIYTSEVNNPFLFPLTGINTIGTGKILGICSAAKALSQGQFGQFPLYAFTTDGVWALEVSDAGSYAAVQPISRDVCINPESITQIDSAVLFVTDRGIMLISGSEVMCISDILNSGDVFVLSDLPKSDKVLGIYNDRACIDEKVGSCIDMLPFIEFLKECRMIYDYTNQRIIVYNTDVCYAYVYSMKSRAWGMMRSDITGGLNSYPEALAMAVRSVAKADTDGTTVFETLPVLVDFSKSSEQCAAVMIMTRPFTMGDPRIFKTVDTIIQRGMFRSGRIAQILYGSNDLYHWHVVWSSADRYMRGFSGSPYKAFRLVLAGRLDVNESISGFTVQFTPRMLNRPR